MNSLEPNASLSLEENKIFNPPGGLAIWFFITIELLTYAAAIVVFIVNRNANLQQFTQDQAALNTTLGTINTLLLITSGLLVAQAVSHYKADDLKRSANKLFVGAAFGFGFICVKLFEYNEKINAGHDIGSSEFFNYYWGFTVFHFVHVVLGTLILLAMAMQLRKGKRFIEADAGIEAGAAFWHMCDLIWIVIFPMFYLLK